MAPDGPVAVDGIPQLFEFESAAIEQENRVWHMPPRPNGICRHCCGIGWIVGRGLCRKCYTSPVLRNLYLTYRVKRRVARGATYAHCAICGRWRYITGRDRCQSCYRLYVSARDDYDSMDSEREARIEEYKRRAARRLPLFSCEMTRHET
jgi:hypothetical protein